MENKNISKSARRKLFFTRCGVFAIFLLMLLPMLCSAAPPPQTAQVTVTIENPNNIPQDMTISNSTIVGALEFGTNITYGTIINVVDGVADDGETDLPDGEYIMLGIWVEQPSGFNNTLIPNGEPYVIDGLPVFLSASPTLTVAESDEETTVMIIPFVVPVSNPTDSLLNTWTSITNWVISSLSTVQGVFYSEGDTVFPYLDLDNSIEINGTTLYYLTDTQLSGTMYYNGIAFEEANFDQFEQSTIDLDGRTYDLTSFSDHTPLLATNITTGIYLNPAMTLSAQGEGLTLLGTLAVIGVSIGICFLLIGVIQKFLRLRA